MTKYAVLLYEYDGEESPLLSVRDGFDSARRAELFASRVVGSEVARERGGSGVGLVALACVWECDESGVLRRATGEEWEA